MRARKKLARNITVFICLFGMVLFAQRIFSAETAVPVISNQSVAKGTPVPVIMYHHMLHEESRWGEWLISPDEFESDLQYLQEHGYTTMLLSELVSALKGEREMPEKPIVLTFDDGHESTYAYAFPLLKQYGMKGVVSVVGHYCDLFSEDDGHHITYSYLQWDQLREMSESGVMEIGNHSYDLHHVDERKGAAKISWEKKEDYWKVLQADTQKNQELIQQATGKQCVIYAYPFGAYCQEGQELLEEMGIQVTLGCEEKVNYLSEYTSCLYLGRFNRPHGISSESFFSKIAP